jgi:hypothetical protein
MIALATIRFRVVRYDHLSSIYTLSLSLRTVRASPVDDMSKKDKIA